MPWGGFEVLVAFLAIFHALPTLIFLTLSVCKFYQALYGADFPAPDAKDVNPEWLKEANTLRALWANLLALPLTLALLWFTARTLYPKWKPALAGNGSTAGKLWLAVLAWLAIAPVVLVFNSAVNEVFKHFGVSPGTTPLTKLGNRPPVDQVLFVLEACIAAPLREELFFRGILLAWCIGRTKSLATGVSPLTAARPWFVMHAAILLAVILTPQPPADGSSRDWVKTLAPVVFAGLLAVGLALLGVTRTPGRGACAVYATAAFFAVVHSAVWPNPIPLFMLGLGLGWLAVRTNGILVPVIVHGLFNAVSAVFVLRGGAPNSLHRILRGRCFPGASRGRTSRTCGIHRRIAS